MLESMQLANQKLAVITSGSVSKIKTLKVPGYTDLDTHELDSYIQKAYQAQLRYLQDSNLDDWKNFCQATVMERSRQGIRYFSVIQSFEIMIEVLGCFFKSELAACTEIDGQPSAKVLERLERRLQGLRMLTVSTITAAGLREIRVF